MALGWFYSPSQILHYFPSRVTSLKPPRAQLKNPYAILRQLNAHQWNMFFVGFAAWAWDAFDFFTISLTATEIAKDFGEEPSAITWGITVTLMLRSVGALISGSVSDRYGRKYVMIANLCLFIVLELASGFTNNLSQLLAVRALYGIAMGGLLGPAAATALEDLPYDARGILSGLFQQGYAVGYLLAAVFYRALVPNTPHGWRSLFWFGAGPPVFIIIWRWCLPETNHFLVMKAEREERELQKATAAGSTHDNTNNLRAFAKDANKAMRQNWVLFAYMVVMMTGYNSVSHGSQDLFPTYLKNQVYKGPTQVTVVTVVGQIGALIGSTLVGYLSTFTGRRLAMMTSCCIGGALVPAYIFTRNDNIIATTFFEQFFVGGSWGPVPVHLLELSPPVLRSFTVGVTYQLGNLASSAASTIEATIGERFPLPPSRTGTKRFDYGKVIGIFLGAVWAYILLVVFLGPEMTQEERDEEAVTAQEFEEMRARGVSLAEIGVSRARMDEKNGRMEVAENAEHFEEKTATRHIEEARSNLNYTCFQLHASLPTDDKAPVKMTKMAHHTDGGLAKLQKYYNGQASSDIVVFTNKGHGYAGIYAHEVGLVSCSVVLTDMMFPNAHRLHLKSGKPEAVIVMIRYIYGHSLADVSDEKSLDYAIELCEIADTYQISSLQASAIFKIRVWMEANWDSEHFVQTVCDWDSERENYSDALLAVVTDVLRAHLKDFKLETIYKFMSSSDYLHDDIVEMDGQVQR
ncbi:hypothetical protein LTR08_006855 [Meristemomyces frigidus]|nr:hypothetical protein LTR08_006855 [Meristemomyces frigidus]